MSNDSNSFLKTLINGSAWSFIGVLLAAGFFYWQEYRNPFDFRIELVDEFNLVEVKEKISDLKILYKEEDILKSEKEIKVIFFGIANFGDTILQSYYDQLEPFGLDFGNVKVLNVEVINSNSSDLKRKLIKKRQTKPQQENNRVLFSKVIFETGDLIIFKVTTLQLANEQFSVKVLGNLANIDKLKVVPAESKKSDPTPTWVWVITGYVALFLGMFILAASLEFLRKKKRREKVKGFRANNTGLSEAEEKIISLYLSGESKNYLIKRMLNNDYVLELNEYVKDEIKNKSKFPLSILSTQVLRPETMPKEIFKVDGANVVFNPKYECFIRDFFSTVL